MDTYGEGKERRRKEKVVLPTSGGEATNLENMGALYSSVCSWDTEEEGDINFPSWKGVDEYQDPLEPTLLSAYFADVFPELECLMN